MNVSTRPREAATIAGAEPRTAIRAALAPIGEWMTYTASNVPAVLVLTYQAYVFRSRAGDERRLWREFTEIARSQLVAIGAQRVEKL